MASALSDMSVSEDSLFARLFERQHSADEASLASNTARQEALLARAAALAAALPAPAGEARAAACQRLARACALFGELAENEKEGINFYADLQGLLVKVLRAAKDFAYARGTERNDRYQESYTQPQQPQPPPYFAGAVQPAYAVAPPSYHVATASAPPPSYNYGSGK